MEETIKKIINVLGEIEGIKAYALIGGLAVGGWVVPRATRDVDLLVDFCESNRDSINDRFLRVLKDAGFEGELHVGAPNDDIRFCIKAVSSEGVPVDIIFVTRKWEEGMVEDGIPIEILDGVTLPLVRPEGLIVLKLKAGSFQDIADVSRLLMETHYDREKMEALVKRARVDRRLQRLMEKLDLV